MSLNSSMRQCNICSQSSPILTGIVIPRLCWFSVQRRVTGQGKGYKFMTQDKQQKLRVATIALQYPLHVRQTILNIEARGFG